MTRFTEIVCLHGVYSRFLIKNVMYSYIANIYLAYLAENLKKSQMQITP